jgi:hypothetical protein
MKKLYVLLVILGTISVTAVFAGGIQERDGQAYSVSVWATTFVQAFAAEGKFEAMDTTLGPEDSEDGTFKNGVWYWGGFAQLQSSGTVRSGNSFKFRAGDDEEYIWLTAKYTGKQPVTVSNKEEGYLLLGTLTFVRGKPVIEIRYVEVYES